MTLPVIDVAASIRFYRTMGFELIVEEPHYARFRSSVGDATFSVHAVGKIFGPSQTVVYFECQSLDEEVVALQAKGIGFFQEPRDEPWLWREGVRAIPPATRSAFTMLGRTGLPRHGE
ncbi:MAG: VOC family protein [Nitrospira sp.]